MSDVVDLTAQSEAVLAAARESTAGRASHSVVHGEHLRAVLIALVTGAGLAEHDSPTAATLHVISGACRLAAGEREWDLGAGELIAIPHERHSVVAEGDCVLLLTVTV